MSVKLESRWKLDIRGIFKTQISPRFQQNPLPPQSSSIAETISPSGWPHERRMTSFIFSYFSLNLHNCTLQNVIRLPRRKLVPGHFYINLVVEEAYFLAETISTSGLPHERRMTSFIFSFYMKICCLPLQCCNVVAIMCDGQLNTALEKVAPRKW